MSRVLVSVNYLIPGQDQDHYLTLDSDRSLFDADIILFRPGIPFSYYPQREDTYQGKPTLSADGSARAVEAARHWRQELLTAVQAGKTVVIFLAKPEEVFVYTGEQQVSGTGRNQKVTSIVRPFSSYDYLPVSFSAVVPRGGKAIKATGDLGPLAPYWADFGPVSPYDVYVEGEFTKVLLTTRTGDKVVGALIRSGPGHLVLVPPVGYDEEQFTNFDEKTEEEFWTDEGIAFGARLSTSLVALDHALRGDREGAPPPEWVKEPAYSLPREAALQEEIRELGEQITGLQTTRSEKLKALSHEGLLRRLLYERGTPLEDAVLDALRLLGFDSERYKAEGSEFDVVFTSAEGRFLGEVEGRDAKAINIDKLGQLERNVQEDFAREEVTAPAKGVLFGNAFRLTSIDERGAYFTEKCIAGAKRSGIALVRTPDLFVIARYLRGTGDTAYAEACRQALLSTQGEVVIFPRIPDPPAGPAET